jgi:predicted peroxiredoxin
MQTTERHHSTGLKMAAPLRSCTKEEERSVIRFLTSQGVKLETKRKGKEWRHCSSPKPEKFLDAAICKEDYALFCV